ESVEFEHIDPVVFEEQVVLDVDPDDLADDEVCAVWRATDRGNRPQFTFETGRGFENPWRRDQVAGDRCQSADVELIDAWFEVDCRAGHLLADAPVHDVDDIFAGLPD